LAAFLADFFAATRLAASRAAFLACFKVTLPVLGEFLMVRV